MTRVNYTYCLRKYPAKLIEKTGSINIKSKEKHLYLTNKEIIEAIRKKHIRNIVVRSYDIMEK